jgi:hypothetical protein
LVKDATENRAVKSQFRRLKSIVDITKSNIVKQELLRVCVLLAAADTEGVFDTEFMNKLLQTQELVVTVH